MHVIFKDTLVQLVLVTFFGLAYAQRYEYAERYDGMNVDCSRVQGVLFLRNPKRCDQYFQCAYGFTYLVDCPSGFYFSSTQSRCVYLQDSDCAVSDIFICYCLC